MKQTSPITRDALNAHQEASLKNTEERLKQACERIRNGTPSIVKPGVKITVSSVAKEAGIERSTLYRFHKAVLADISNSQNVDPQRIFLAEREKAKQETYLHLAEQAQAEVKALARHNYQLSVDLDNVRRLLQEKEDVIRELRKELTNDKKSLSAIGVRSSTSKNNTRN